MNKMKQYSMAICFGLLTIGVGSLGFAQDGDKKKVAEPEVKIDAALDAKIQAAIGQAKSGNVKEAITALSALQDKVNGGALAAYNLGLLYEQSGDTAKAATAYTKSLAQDAGFSPSLLNLVRLYIREGQIGDAQKITTRYVGLRPRNLNHRAAELQIKLAQKKYEDVERGAKSLMRKNYKHVEAMLALADANYALGRYELTKTILGRAVKFAPRRADIFNRFGLIEIKLKEDKKAIVNFKAAIERQDTHPEANNNLGTIYHKARDYSNAIVHYKKALKGYPNYKEAYLNMGNSLKGQKKFKEADAAFRKAIAIDKSYADSYFNLAVLHLDSAIPGMDKVARLEKSVALFEQYKGKVGSGLSKSDPTNKYIAEAKKSIKDEKARQELMRQSPKTK